MKKVILSMMILASLFASCSDTDNITNNYITEEHYDGAQLYTTEYTIQPKDWNSDKYSDGRPYLYATFENKNITDDVMDYGAVLGYVWNTYNHETGASSWNPMPFVYPFIFELSEEDVVVVGENIRFEYERETITFVIEDLDGIEPLPMDCPLIVKVVVMTR